MNLPELTIHELRDQLRRGTVSARTADETVARDLDGPSGWHDLGRLDLLQHCLCEFGLASEDDAPEVGLLRHLALPILIREVFFQYWSANTCSRWCPTPNSGHDGIWNVGTLLLTRYFFFPSARSWRNSRLHDFLVGRCASTRNNYQQNIDLPMPLKK